ncbi:MAG: tetratricopeptide repeat protein [Proteobacteria bacterium]|nr:tetratricopeptide repeat protein [Pseudomonadota bacterium]
MTKSGYLTQIKNPLDKRSTLYTIKEGLFDLWLAMSQSRTQRKYLPFVVDFLEGWYSSQPEREQKRMELKNQITASRDPSPDNHRQNLDEMLSYLTEVGEDREKIETKFDLLSLKLEKKDFAEAGKIFKEIDKLEIKGPVFLWMRDSASQWMSGDKQEDIADQMQKMITLWEHQRSGHLEKLAVLAKKLSTQFTDRGLHQLNVAMIQDILSKECPVETRLALMNRIYYSQQMEGKYNEAQATLEPGLKIAQENNLQKWEGLFLNNLSTLHHARGDYDKAAKYLEQALKIQQEIGDKEGEGVTLNNLSQIHDARGDYDEAAKYLKQALKIRREIGDKKGEGVTLNNISQIHHDRGDYDEATKHLKQSLMIRQEIGDKEGEGTTLNNISTLHHAHGDYEGAEKYLKQALKIQREIGDKKGEGATLNNISQIHRAHGDYNEAEKYLKQSLKIQREIGDRSSLCVTLINLGHIHYQNEEIEKAISAWVTTYQIARETKEAKALTALEQLAKDLGKDGLDFWETLLQQMEQQK